MNIVDDILVPIIWVAITLSFLEIPIFFAITLIDMATKV